LKFLKVLFVDYQNKKWEMLLLHEKKYSSIKINAKNVRFELNVSTNSK